MTINLPQGDLSRATSHDPEDEWPTTIEVVAYWAPPPGKKKGRVKTITISADQFFGRGAYGAPMSGDQLIHAIERMRKS